MSGAGPSARRWAAQAGADAAGARVDRWLAASLPELSRMRLKALIDAGAVRVDGRATKASHRLRGGERVEADIPPPPSETLAPEPIPLLVVLEDDDLLVVDKPAGMVTHPGAGQPAGTLAAAALAHAPGMAGVGGPRRPGIVHRLDKGTSGLIVLAKSAAAYASLTAQLARRTVSRGYLCLVWGIPGRDGGVVDAPIARDPRSRLRMAVAPPGKGKGAVTRYRVLERFRAGERRDRLSRVPARHGAHAPDPRAPGLARPSADRGSHLRSPPAPGPKIPPWPGSSPTSTAWRFTRPGSGFSTRSRALRSSWSPPSRRASLAFCHISGRYLPPPF